MTIFFGGVYPDFRHTQTHIQSSRVLQSPSEFSSAVAVETRGSCSTIQWQCTHALNGSPERYMAEQRLALRSAGSHQTHLWWLENPPVIDDFPMKPLDL